MKKQSSGDAGWHPGPRIDAIPVVGVGGLIFTIGIALMFAVGLPIAKQFLLAAVPAGFLALVIIRVFRKLRPRTEEEELQLNVGRQTRQP
jgi:hypothetical protein